MPDAPPLFRRARAEDVPAIVRLLADDPLGRTRERDETPLPPSYLEAFAAIDRDPNNELVVACRDAAVVNPNPRVPCRRLRLSHVWRVVGSRWGRRLERLD